MGFDLSGLSYLRSYVEKKCLELHSHPEKKINFFRKKINMNQKETNKTILYCIE